MRRLLPLLLLLVACRRELDLPAPPAGDEARPPRVTHAELLDVPRAAPSLAELPVLGGELVVLRGEALSEAQPIVGGEPAAVLAAEEARLVFEVPVSPALGAIALVLEGPEGRVELPTLLRVDGLGAPAGLRTGSIPTQATLRRLAEVRLTPVAATFLGADATFSTMVLASGGGDAVELILGASGAGLLTIPTGVIPAAIAGVVGFTDDARVEVTAFGLDRQGRLGRGAVVMDQSFELTVRAPSLVDLDATIEVDCKEEPELLLTSAGSRLAGALVGAERTRLFGVATGGGAVVSSGQLDGVLAGWSALPDDRSVALLLRGAPEPFRSFDTQTGEVAPLLVGGERLLSRVRAASCEPSLSVDAITSLALTPDASLVAVSFERPGQLGEVVVFDVATGAQLGRGTAAPGTAPVAFGRVEGEERLFAVGGFGLMRFARTPVSTAPWSVGCDGPTPPDGLEVDAIGALPVLLEPISPAVGGLLAMRGGLHSSSLLALSTDGVVHGFLASTMGSVGELYRPAPYGRLSVATAGKDPKPILVAEHTRGLRLDQDVGATALLVPLDGRDRIAVGPSAFARGVAALTGLEATLHLAADPLIPVEGRREALADGVGTLEEWCGDFALRLTTALRPPGMLVQGPAREGRFGPDGLGRHGPASAPIWREQDGTLYAHDTATEDACLRTDALATCRPSAELPLALPAERALLDVTPSAGDRTFAVRTLALAGCRAACATSKDAFCERETCAVSETLLLRSLDRPAVEVSLAGRPVSVAADRAGGFLVTVACDGADPQRCLDALGCGGRDLISRREHPGALLYVGEDDGRVSCLATAAGLAGPLQPTPNGRELWIVGADDADALELFRLALPRELSRGRIDPKARVDLLGREPLGPTVPVPHGFTASGLAFTPDGGLGFVSLPVVSEILTYE